MFKLKNDKEIKKNQTENLKKYTKRPESRLAKSAQKGLNQKMVKFKMIQDSITSALVRKRRSTIVNPISLLNKT